MHLPSLLPSFLASSIHPSFFLPILPHSLHWDTQAGKWVEEDKDSRGGTKGLQAAREAEEEEQRGGGQKGVSPGSGLDPNQSRLCQTCLKLAWQELSLQERRPGSRGESTERPLCSSAGRLILTFPRAPGPSPSPAPNDSVSRFCNPQRRGLNSLQPHPPLFQEDVPARQL